MAKTIDITIPDLGDFADVEVIEVLVSAGDTVEREGGLITVETDKASMDVPATAAGVVMTLSVGVGSKVSQGDPILTLKTTGTDDAVETGSESGVAPSGPPPPEAAAPGKSPGRDTETLRVTDEKGFAEAHASPSVRRFARELGVDAVVKGSILRSADSVRLSAQLVGEEGNVPLWSDTFDRPRQDSPALPGQVAQAIAGLVDQKTGNYLIFFPSYEYMMMVLSSIPSFFSVSRS